MSTVSSFHKICNFFKLGNFVEVVVLPGGRSHHVYRLTTDQGDYVVKHLVVQPNKPLNTALF